jgi:microcystin-dependent protein
MPLPIDNYQASLALTQSFVVQGVFPSPDGDPGGIPLAAIRTFAGNFAIGAGAEGQLIPINQNQALFSLLGTMYGGNGTSTFALPDLDGRTLIGGAPLQYFGRPPIGSSGITLSSDQLPASMGGSSQLIDNYQPSQPIIYLIREQGIFPSEGGGGGVNMIGEIVPFAGTFVPGGYLEAAGQTLQIADHETLFQLIGTTYGGDGVNTFQLPDLRGRTIVGASPQLPLGATEGQAEALLFNGNLPASLGGSGQPFDNQEPSLALTYLIALQGIFPSRDGGGFSEVEPCLGEVIAFAGNFAPKGWAVAAGQLLPINQNQALFSLLGTMYGGNGQTTFALPDLRGRTVIGTGDVADAGDVLGTDDATVLSANIPDVHLTGTSGPNILYGADGNDTLDGAGGADTMIGGLGNDTYTVDNIGDVVTENPASGADTVRTGLASYTLPTNVEYLVGTSATGQALTGNALDNVITGAAGADAMSGGSGNDAYVVDNAGDAVTETVGQGNDTAFASINYRLTANVDNLILQGSADLQGYGNGLVNALFGNTGNNILNGNGGADTMTGGAGNDVFMFNVGQANGDTITDFDGQGPAAGDVLQFFGYGAGATFTQNDATHWQINYDGGASHEVIAFSNGASVHAIDYIFL